METGTALHRATFCEHTSDLVLVIAYAISLYLCIRIPAAFLPGALMIHTAFNEHIATAAVIRIIGIVVYSKGIDMLQNLEKIAHRHCTDYCRGLVDRLCLLRY